MAALPYIQLYVADYLADTMHLTTEQHGAYLLLIFNYWQTGKPILKEDAPMITKVPNDRWTGVERALQRFFNDTGTHWEHGRIERDLEAVKGKIEQAQRAGKASANAKKQRNGNGTATGVERALNGRSESVATERQRNGNQLDTDTDTDTDKKRLPLPPQHGEGLFAEDEPPPPQKIDPPDQRTFADLRIMHPVLFVGKDEREDWQRTFATYGWDCMDVMAKRLIKQGKDRIFLSEAQAWLAKNTEDVA